MLKCGWKHKTFAHIPVSLSWTKTCSILILGHRVLCDMFPIYLTNSGLQKSSSQTKGWHHCGCIHFFIQSMHWNKRTWFPLEVHFKTLMITRAGIWLLLINACTSYGQAPPFTGYQQNCLFKQYTLGLE